jgi:hypothetical protein
MNRSTFYALSALALAFAQPALADNRISAITPGASSAVLVDGKATMRFVVSGQGGATNDCGIWVTYGDKDSPDTRVIGKGDGLLPREFTHTFTQPGQYSVIAKGTRVKQTFGCDGEASTTFTVLAAAAGRRVGSQACPPGWALRQGSTNQSTGAFSCVATYPEQRIDCGRGLSYFESDGQIGCRVRGRGRNS